jgi:hypothetical protein
MREYYHYPSQRGFRDSQLISDAFMGRTDILRMLLVEAGVSHDEWPHSSMYPTLPDLFCYVCLFIFTYIISVVRHQGICWEGSANILSL